MGLRGTEARLPPGFRFHPRDEELVCYYLYGKIGNRGGGGGGDDGMVEVDLHTCPPWKLPLEAKLGANEWYFFNFRDRKYATGSRTNRATTEGYWKATGKDRSVHDLLTEAVVGMRKTLVFYLGRAPKGIKTSWVMHEFRVENPNMPPKEDWVLCRVFKQTRGDPPKLLGMEYENCSITNPSPCTDHNHQFMFHHPVLSHESCVLEHSSSTSSALDHMHHHHQVHDHQHGHEVVVLQNPFMQLPSSDQHFSTHHNCCSTSSNVFLNSGTEIMGDQLQYHDHESLYLPPLMMMEERSDPHHVDKFEFLVEDIRMEEQKLMGCRDFGLINVAAHDQDQEIVLE